jgi:hypothetical protein
LTHQVSKISTLHSPIANLEHPFTLSVSNDAVVWTPLAQAIGKNLVIASAQCKTIFQVGDRRMQIADFGNLMRQVYECPNLGGQSLLNSEFLCKAGRS